MLPALLAVLAFCAQAQGVEQRPPAWLARGSAVIDPASAGWVQLTGATSNSLGTVLASQPFAIGTGIALSFSYAVWGGGEPGGDGLSVFLYDAAKDMNGARAGGGLGYCQGSGGWLAVALDEFGNFSHPQDACGNGPGPRPQSLVVRGPVAERHPLVAQAPLPGKVDRPGAAARPAAGQILMHVIPRATGTGYLVHVHARSGSDAQWVRLVGPAEFPFPSPPLLRVGAAGSTGAARNVHEIRDLVVKPLPTARVSHTFEPAVLQTGGQTTLTLRLATSAKASLLEPVTYELPPGLKVATPLQLGGTCSGAVRARPGDSSVTVDAGTTATAAGCTLAFRLTASRPVQWQAKIPAGAWPFDTAANEESAAATLSVGP